MHVCAILIAVCQHECALIRIKDTSLEILVDAASFPTIFE